MSFCGQVNTMVLRADQGPNGQTFVADNDGSGSRIEITAETGTDGLTGGLETVVSAEIKSSHEIDFGSTGDGTDGSGPLGDFRQAHVDLLGTGFTGAGSDVDDVAGGLHFSADDGTDLAALDTFFDIQDGARAVRAPFVSPDLAGFDIALSVASSASPRDATAISTALVCNRRSR